MCECNEATCYCEGGYGNCSLCGKRTSYVAEWDGTIWLCLACSDCDRCNGRKAAECDSCGGYGEHTSGDPRGPDYRESGCSQCHGTGRVACPECCEHSSHGRDAASREDAVVARYEARLAAANY